jgi:hypothetical protein
MKVGQIFSSGLKNVHGILWNFFDKNLSVLTKFGFISFHFINEQNLLFHSNFADTYKQCFETDYLGENFEKA